MTFSSVKYILLVHMNFISDIRTLPHPFPGDREAMAAVFRGIFRYQTPLRSGVVGAVWSRTQQTVAGT